MVNSITLTPKNNEQQARIITAFKNTYKIPEVEGQPTFTNAQWFRKKLIDYVKGIVVKYELKIQRAQLSINVDNLIE